ncbi:uncharacterized protein LOC114249054 [Bombyx mandarina]|uniref:Uncharacterized protein LOC114249054 n=1 Tax=Bombyx mandarina TaxID=7092 RepID=A0A6J2KBL8_BOMMA|nr:uncharacterized protein LOC114249054 [Bombyx mandarina]
MERALNPQLEADTIYEIYRSCRLCGAGAGYKMPIIQNVIIDDSSIELSIKIRECLQIKVHQDDKMPPLICELCVDKVNDFYEFLDMCRRTNIRTRQRLGLPVNIMKTAENADSNTSILGVTEPIVLNDDSDDDLPIKKKSVTRDNDKKNNKSVKAKKETVTEKNETTRSSRNRKRSNGSSDLEEIPCRVTRSSLNGEHIEKQALKQLKSLLKNRNDEKSIIKTETKVKIENDLSHCDSDEDSLLVPRVKRIREVKLDIFPKSKKVRISEPPKPSSKSKKKVQPDKEDLPVHSPLPHRKAKVLLTRLDSPPAAVKPPATPFRTTRNSLSCYISDPPKLPDRSVSPPRQTERNSKSSPNPAKLKSRSASLRTSVTPENASLSVIKKCVICNQNYNSIKSYNNHMRVHVPTYTKSMLACDACRVWFVDSTEAARHKQLHTSGSLPYKCHRCTAEYKLVTTYDEHFKNDCIPFDEVPDVKCEDCWRYFATDNLLIQHNCAGEDGRPGGKCMKCKRNYVLLKNLKKHEETCTFRSRLYGATVDPEIAARLMPAQVRICRCDVLLKNMVNGHYVVSGDLDDFGLDKSCFYPYSARSIRVKAEPVLKNDNMVNITQDITDVFDSDTEISRWDSDNNSNGTSKVKTSNFTAKLKLSNEIEAHGKGDAFDAVNDSEFDLSSNINCIIDGLDRDEENRLVDDKEKSDAVIDFDCRSIDTDAGSLSLLDETTKTMNDDAIVHNDELTDRNSDSAQFDNGVDVSVISEKDTNEVELGVNENSAMIACNGAVTDSSTGIDSAVINNKVYEKSNSFDIETLLNKTESSSKSFSEERNGSPFAQQIGDNQFEINEKTNCEVTEEPEHCSKSADQNDKINIEDLLDGKRMELDDTSNDDFNFDV